MNDFDRWLKQMPLQEVESELLGLEAQQAEITAQIETRQRAIALHRALQPTSENVPTAPEPPVQQLATSAAVRKIMESEPSRSWKLEELQEQMVQRKWASRSPALRNRIQAAARRMAERGELLRPEVGYYQLASAPDPLLRPWGPDLGFRPTDTLTQSDLRALNEAR